MTMLSENEIKNYISIVRSQVGKGIYVWGAKGEDVSAMSDPKSWITKKETKDTEHTKEQNIKRALTLLEKRKKNGVNPILAFDCSGFVSWALKTSGIFKSRLSANSFYKRCREINKSELKRGDLLFKHNGTKATHVGIYIGENKIVDCRGRDVGVVEQKMPTWFNVYGRLPEFQNGSSDTIPEPSPAPTPSNPISASDKFVVVKGKVRVINGVKKPDKKVNIRAGNGTKFKDIGTAVSEDKFRIVKQEDLDPHWYRIEYKNGEAWITSNSRYVEVIPCE